jgi:sugar lactone lactonase YvrE
VTPDPAEQAKLYRIDGIAFDSAGNLFGVLEISDPSGGVVSIDIDTGAVTPLTTGIPRADQIALHPSGDFFVTSEVSPAATSQRLYRVSVQYNGSGVPTSAIAVSVVTNLEIDHPEGLVVLAFASAFGDAGDVYVAEDLDGGGIFLVDPADGSTQSLVTGLSRPEGMDLGDFSGQAAPALYVAETTEGHVRRVDASGATGVFGTPGDVGLSRPDNVRFGPDGFLYVSEDRSPPLSRVVRIASDGGHEVVLTGFDEAQGMAFHPVSGDLYVSEQGLSRIWRLRFTQDDLPVPALGPAALAVLAFAIAAAAWRAG